MDKEAQAVVEKFLADVKESSQGFRSWSKEEMETLYSAGYSLYQQGSYEKASQIFIQLTMSNPFEERFWRGLASALQMQKDYDAALHAWSLSALLAEDDALPHFHAAECLFSSEQKEEALKALHQAEIRLTKEQKMSRLEEKISILKQLCQEGSYV